MMVSTGIVPVPPITGGAIESHVFALANALADRGALVHYIGDIRGGTPHHYNVRYHPVHSPIRSFPLPFPGWIMSHLVGGALSARVSYGITLQKKIDVAHFHEEASALSYLRFRPKAPTIFTLHNPPPWLGESPSGIETWFRRTITTIVGKQVIAKTNHFIALSPIVATEFTKWLGLDSDRVSVVQHPVDTDFFKPDERSEIRARRKFGLNEPYLVFVGRLDKRKGVSNLLRALAILPSSINAVIVGQGPQGEELAKLSRELNIESKTRFVGPVALPFLPGLISGAECMVLPSSLEMSPLTVIEALACGTPVVATDLAVLVGIIENGRNGLLVPHDAKALANAISLLTTDDSLRKRMRDNARNGAVANNSLSSIANRLLRIYHDAVQS